MTLKEYAEQASEVALKSHGLWRGVNFCIAGMLSTAIKNHKSRKSIVVRFRKLGQRNKNDPVCLSNYLVAANSIEYNTDLRLL